MDYLKIQALGPRITDLTGIELLHRLNLLKARDHEMPEFDGANHPNLKGLGIVNDQLGLVDLTLNPELWYLDIGGENLVDLDVSANTKLRTLYINDGPNISELDLSQHLEIVRLEVDGTGISSLDLTNNVQLISFGCFNNVSLTSLIMGNAPDLAAILCNQNALELLDILALISLENLSANANNFTEINLSSNPNIRTISLFENSLITLDISSNPNIESMLLTNNDLESLDLRNGNNEILTLILGFENLDLYCVDVDDAAAAPYGNWLFSNSVVYSEDCSLGVNDNEQLQPIIYPNPVREMLTIESQEIIQSVEVYSIRGELITSERGNGKIDFLK